MKFNKVECKLLHLCQGSPRLGNERIESGPVEKDFGEQVHEKLNMSQQCALTAQKSNCILGYIKSSVTSKSRELILLFCCALVRPYPECCIQL